MLRSEGDRLRRVVVCSPQVEFEKGKNDPVHNIGGIEGAGVAARQHDTLKQRMRDFGVEVLDAPELPGHPNSVFTRDTATSTPQGYVRLRPGLASRTGEEAWTANRLDAVSEPCAGVISPPATVEGGDVVLAGKVAFVGLSVRTNQEGIRQLSEILEPLGYEVRVVTLPDDVLHLDKALMTLGGDRLLYCDDLIDPDTLNGFHGIAVTSGPNATANVIYLGDDEVIVNEQNSVVQEVLAREGYTVHALQLSEFARGMGGPNCLIMPIDRR